MTLKAAIIYIQGSGGNLLARTLTLGEDTIPYVPQEVCIEQPRLKMSYSQRLMMYNNWNPQNWIESEKLALWYRGGKNDFWRYEDSPLHMIAQFHPHEFEIENQKKVLWHSLEQWQNIIFIDFDKESLYTIAELAKQKRPDLAHYQQIWSNELAAFERLRDAVPISIKVQWRDMLRLDRYIDIICHLVELLKIEPIDVRSICNLHQSWLAATKKILDPSRFTL